MSFDPNAFISEYGSNSAVAETEGFNPDAFISEFGESDLQQSGTAEKPEQIQSQFDDMMNPTTSRDTVFVGANTQMPDVNTENLHRVDTPDGTLFTTNSGKAKQYKANPNNAARAKALGYDENKDDILGDNPFVIVVTDKKGNRVAEELSTDTNTNATIRKYIKNGYNPKDGYNISVESPAQTQETRVLPEILYNPAAKVKAGLMSPDDPENAVTNRPQSTVNFDRNKSPIVKNIPTLAELEAVIANPNNPLNPNYKGREEYKGKQGQGFVEARDRFVYAARKAARILPKIQSLLGVDTEEEDNPEKAKTRKALMDDMPKEFTGVGGITVPATEEVAQLAVEWTYLYPGLFKMAGLGNEAIASIPAVKKAGQIIENSGGIKAITEKFPRAYQATKNAIDAGVKGFEVGAGTELVAGANEGKATGQRVKDIAVSGGQLATVGAILSGAGSIDERLKLKATKEAMVKRLVSDLQKLTAQTSSAAEVKSLNQYRDNALRYIDKAVAGLESEITGFRKSNLYPNVDNAKLAKSTPAKTIDRFLQYGYEPGREMGFKAPEPLLTKMGVREPVDVLKGEPTTRTGEVVKAITRPVETVKEAIKDIRSNVKPQSAAELQRPATIDAKQVKYSPGEMVEVTQDGGKTWLKRKVFSGINNLTKKPQEPVVDLDGKVFADGKTRRMVVLTNPDNPQDTSPVSIESVRKITTSPTDAQTQGDQIVDTAKITLFRAMTKPEYEEWKRTGIIGRQRDLNIIGGDARATKDYATAKYYAEVRGEGSRVIKFEVNSSDVREMGTQGNYKFINDVKTHEQGAPINEGRFISEAQTAVETAPVIEQKTLPPVGEEQYPSNPSLAYKQGWRIQAEFNQDVIKKYKKIVDENPDNYQIFRTKDGGLQLWKKNLDPEATKNVEYTEKGESDEESGSPIREESETGIQDISPDRDTQRGSSAGSDRPAKSSARKPGAAFNEDVLGDEPAVSDSVQEPEILTETVGVEGQQASGKAGKGIHGDRTDEVVSVASRTDDKSDSEPSLAKNYDLRNAEPVRLTKGQRKVINDQVKTILQKDTITVEDREVLRQYTGEGGISSGSQEALNQHYTDYDTIRRMFDVIDESDFKYEKVLEPSVGSGNFVGMRPGKKWTTVDIDETNYKVVSKLYPKGTHYHTSYEDYIESGHDLIISNVPFLEQRGKGKLKNRPDIKALHDFYFAHSLDLVKDNGIIAFITSTGTMDKLDNRIREEVISKADIIGAFRLPQGHFSKNAHTEVTTDVIFMQKRPIGVLPNDDQTKINEAWTKVTKDEQGLKQNDYYGMFPANILGDVEIGKDKLHGGKPIYVVSGQARLDDMRIGGYKPYTQNIDNIIKNKETGIPKNSHEFTEWAVKNNIFYRRQNGNPAYKENIIIDDPAVYVFDTEVSFDDVKDKVKIYKSVASSEARKALYLNRIKKAAELYQTSLDKKYADDGIEQIAEYRKEYKIHPAKDKKLKAFFENNDEESFYLELNSYFDTSWNPAKIFTEQVRHSDSGKIKLTSRLSLKERAFASENNKGVINIEHSGYLEMAEVPALLESGYSLTSYSNDNAILQNDILYYAGNVYEKIEQTQKVRLDVPENLTHRIEEQIGKLEVIKPEVKPLSEIRFHGTEEWVLPFVKNFIRIEQVRVKDKTGNTRIEWHCHDKIFTKHLNNNALVSRKSFDVGGVTVQEPISEYMMRLAEAQEHVEQVLDDIKNRIADKPELLQKAEHAYNSRFRNYVRPDYAKAKYLIQDVLDEAEKNSGLTMRRNQVDWIVQAVYEGKGINAHDVGGGKTYAAIIMAKVLKERGIAKKPLFVVPAKTIKKWERDIKKLFPDTKIVSLGKLAASERTKALFELANSNADYVLISHDGFTHLKLPVETEIKYVDEVLQENMADPDKTGRAAGLLEQKIDTYKEILDNDNRDTRLTFDKLGIDMIVADEAHAYKNIGIRNDLVKFGLGVSFGVNHTITDKKESVSLESARSYDFRFKTSYITEHNNGNNIFLLTATPTPNKPMEIFTMLRHLNKSIFGEYGIHSDKDFANTFFKLGTVESHSSGKPKNVLTAIVNAQELRGILNRFVDKIAMEEMPWIEIPKENTQEHFLEQSDSYAIIAADLEARRKELPPKPVPGEDTVISIYTGGRAASIDPRLYGGQHAGVNIDTRTFDVSDDKIEFAINHVADVHKKNKNAGQLIFLDMSGHTQVDRGQLPENLHAEIKEALIKKGFFKQNEIAIINGKVVTNVKTGNESGSGDKDQKKQDIADAYNDGKVKVLIGSTSSMGEGMDLQIKTTDIYHLDIPYTPGAFRQRNGRGIRFGNENKIVNIHYLFMKGTFDSLSFNIITHKKGWNHAIWDKDVADEISTAEEMASGVIPKQEQILIELEPDPYKKQVLIKKFEHKRMTEERSTFYQMSRMTKNRIRRTQDETQERKVMLNDQRNRLHNLKPNDTIKDTAKRKEMFENSKASLERLITISERKLKEFDEQLTKLKDRKEQIEKESAELETKLADFTKKYFDEDGNFRVPKNDGDDPTTDVPSIQGGFAGIGRPRAAAMAKVSAITQESMSTGSEAADRFMETTKGFVKSGRPGSLKKTAQHLWAFGKGFHFLPELPKTEVFADIRESFRHLMEIAKISYSTAVEKMKWSLEPVEGTTKEAQMRIQAVRMKLIADDMYEDMQSKVDLPPGLEAADVRAIKNRADELYNTYPSVREAYDRLRQSTQEITDMLVSEGWLNAEQAKEFYYPHKVIKYLRNEDSFFGLGIRKPAVPAKKYLKQRKGGADYSTDVLERLIEHWAQVRRDVETSRFLDKVLKQEQAEHFKEEYPEWTQSIENEAGKKTKNLIPDGYKEVTVLPGRYYYRANGITEDMATALLEQNLAAVEELFGEDGPKVRTMLAVGKKRSFIVREEIARQLLDMPTAPVSEHALYNGIKSYNTFIKRNILFNPLYAVPFHVTNFVGDAYKVSVALPSALRPDYLVKYWQEIINAHKGKKSELFELAQKYGVIGSGWIGVDVAKMEALIPIVERAELSGGVSVLANKTKALFNALKTAGESREDWLRYCLFARLVDIQAKGINITKYAVKDTNVVKGLTDPTMKAAKIARDIAGDYSAIGKSGVMMSDLVVPFYRWMHLNLPWWPRMIKEYAKRGNAGRLLAALMAASFPYIASMLWNYSDPDRAKFEKSLPPWKRWNFHIVSLHGKKMYYIPLPLDDVINFIGLPETMLDIQRFQRGWINAPELVKRIAINSTYEPGMSLVNAVGGVAGLIVDLIGVETFPDFKDYRVKWSKRLTNALGTMFGAPGSLTERISKGDIKIEDSTLVMNQRTRDMLNRSWMGIRPYSVDIEQTKSILEDSIYKDTVTGHKAGQRYKDGRRHKGRTTYVSDVDSHKRGDAHKGKERKVDSLKIQLEDR